MFEIGKGGMYLELLVELIKNNNKMKDFNEVEQKFKEFCLFEKCGNFEISLYSEKYRCMQLNSIQEVIKSINSTKWENLIIEAQNRLNSYLRKFDNDAYIYWNTIADNAIDSFNRIKKHITDKLFLYKLPDDFLIPIRSTYIRIYIESYYSNIENAPRFFIYLFDIYKQGKLPCGWNGFLPKSEGDQQIDLLNNKILMW